ncbi:hypothetical protein D3C71_998360 [compost metagenome]
MNSIVFPCGLVIRAGSVRSLSTAQSHPVADVGVPQAVELMKRNILDWEPVFVSAIAGLDSDPR